MAPTPESPRSPDREAELFRNYLAAHQEVGAIMKEIHEILAGAEDRGEAERLILKTVANRLDEATQRSRELLDQWL
jgi:hypothetical protein